MRYITAFFFGVITAIATLIIQQFVVLLWEIITGTPATLTWTRNLALSFSLFLPIAVLIEEVCKYFIISKQSTQNTKLYQTIFCAFLIGLGFAVTEIALIAYKLTSQNITSLLLRADIIGIILVHTITAVIAGYFILRFPQNLVLRAGAAIIIMTIMHTTYNVLVLMQNAFPLFVPLFFVGVFFALMLRLLSTVHKKVAQA